MGDKMALTGLVVFVFCLLMVKLSSMPPKQPVARRFFGCFMVLGLFAVPIGLIIQIWS
jgi:hypothetical protein